MKKGNKKVFVIDTNVILHDYMCIYNFQENDVVIPIVCLEELDKFKKGNDEINFNAREFTRELDSISGDDLFDKGISLGDHAGKLFIETGKPFSDEFKKSFPEPSGDHRILAITDYLRNKYSTIKVVFISKDINLRMKAKSIGILAQDYETDKIDNPEIINKNISTFENIDDTIINELYKSVDGVDVSDIKLELAPNQYSILKGNHSSALVYHNPFSKKLERVEKHQTFGIAPRNSEQTFSLHALTNKRIPLISLTGKAGTGKTLLALAAALNQAEEFDYIYLARPIVPLSNKDLGYLPGDVKDKIGPYMQPLFDNLSVIKHQFNLNSKEFRKIEEMQANEKLIITPLAYIRGRSLSNVFFIVDEAQNLTPHEIKTIITRAGEGTKMVFTGDIQQIDSPYLDSCSNGLSYLADRMLNQKMFAHVNLLKGERSELAELASDLL